MLAPARQPRRRARPGGLLRAHRRARARRPAALRGPGGRPAPAVGGRRGRPHRHGAAPTAPDPALPHHVESAPGVLAGILRGAQSPRRTGSRGQADAGADVPQEHPARQVGRGPGLAGRHGLPAGRGRRLPRVGRGLRGGHRGAEAQPLLLREDGLLARAVPPGAAHAAPGGHHRGAAERLADRARVHRRPGRRRGPRLLPPALRTVRRRTGPGPQVGAVGGESEAHRPDRAGAQRVRAPRREVPPPGGGGAPRPVPLPRRNPRDAQRRRGAPPGTPPQPREDRSGGQAPQTPVLPLQRPLVQAAVRGAHGALGRGRAPRGPPARRPRHRVHVARPGGGDRRTRSRCPLPRVLPRRRSVLQRARRLGRRGAPRGGGAPGAPAGNPGVPRGLRARRITDHVRHIRHRRQRHHRVGRRPLRRLVHEALPDLQPADGDHDAARARRPPRRRPVDPAVRHDEPLPQARPRPARRRPVLVRARRAPARDRPRIGRARRRPAAGRPHGPDRALPGGGMGAAPRRRHVVPHH